MLIIPHLLKKYYGYDEQKSYEMAYSSKFIKYLKILTNNGDKLAKSLLPNNESKIKKQYINELINFVDIKATSANEIQVSFLEAKKLLNRMSYYLGQTGYLKYFESYLSTSMLTNKTDNIKALSNSGYYVSNYSQNVISREDSILLRTLTAAHSNFQRGDYSRISIDFIIIRELELLKSMIWNLMFRSSRKPEEALDKESLDKWTFAIKAYIQSILDKNPIDIIKNDSILEELVIPDSNREVGAQSLVDCFTALSSSKDRTTAKLGKLASTLFNVTKDSTTKGILASQISDFVTQFETTYFNENKLTEKEGLFKIVEGLEIPYYYYYKNNDIKREERRPSPLRVTTLNPMDFILDPNMVNRDDAPPGKLDVSCMRSTPHFLDIYAKNPKSIKMLVKFSSCDANKIVGRCILWYASDGKKYFDRIYLKHSKLLKEFYSYLTENEFINIYRGNPGYKQNATEKHISVSLEDAVFKKYPYIDTMMYLNITNKTLSNYDDGSINSVHVQYTNGGISSRLGYSDMERHVKHVNTTTNDLNIQASKTLLYKSIVPTFTKIAYFPKEFKLVEATDALIKEHNLISINDAMGIDYLSAVILVPKEYVDSITDLYKDRVLLSAITTKIENQKIDKAPPTPEEIEKSLEDTVVEEYGIDDDQYWEDDEDEEMEFDTL